MLRWAVGAELAAQLESLGAQVAIAGDRLTATYRAHAGEALPIHAALHHRHGTNLQTGISFTDSIGVAHAATPVAAPGFASVALHAQPPAMAVEISEQVRLDRVPVAGGKGMLKPALARLAGPRVMADPLIGGATISHQHDLLTLTMRGPAQDALAMHLALGTQLQRRLVGTSVSLVHQGPE